MLDSVLYARDKYLQPDGLMVPSQTSILLSGYAGQPWYDDRVKFWDDVYGFDMQAMKDKIEDEAIIEVVDDGEVVSNEVSIAVSAPASLQVVVARVTDTRFLVTGHLYPNGDHRIPVFLVSLLLHDHPRSRLFPERHHLHPARPARPLRHLLYLCAASGRLEPAGAERQERRG